MRPTVSPALLLLLAVARLASSSSCGSSWGSYILASSGAHDCTGCGESIGSYEACALAAASGASHLEIGGLGGSESWYGPPGCHIQERGRFQWNANEEGDSAAGHTPVCLAGAAAASVSSTCACAAEEEQPRFSFHPSPLSWHAAREDCQSRGGDLASIHSAAENREAYSLAGGQDAWLGLNGEEDEDNYVWSDGTPFDYDGWADGEPNNHDGDEDCGGYWSGRGAESWDSMYGEESCGGALAYLCGYAAGSGSSSTYTYHAGPMAYGNAIEACQESGGNLATIRNQAEQDAAFAAVPSGARAYIGLNDRDSEGSFVWANGNAVSYTNWGPSEPNSFSGTDEDCAGFHIYYSSGEWNDFPCGGSDPNDGNVAIGYVCEVPATRARRLSEYGPVAVSSSCASYNCFEASHIPGSDISCETGMSQSQCAEQCCSESDCMGFDYSAAQTRCCTGSVSRADGPFEYNGGSYLSCEKNGVTELSRGPIFVYHSEPETWEGARAVCQAEGGDLASIHNAEENALAHAAIDQAKHAAYHDGTDWPGTWIGLNDRSSEGSWVWSDGSPTDFIAFQEHEPNQGSNENCGFYYFNFGTEWADVHCDQRIGFLCRTQCECLKWSNPETEEGSDAGAIVGGVIGGLGAVGLLFGCGLMVRGERRKARARRMRERVHSQAGVQLSSTGLRAGTVVSGEPLQASAVNLPMPPVAVAQVVYAETVNAYPTTASPAYPSTASPAGYPATTTPAYGAGVASSSTATPMPPLSEACETFKRELGVSGANMVAIVDATCQMLGIKDTAGLSLVQKAEKCWVMIMG